MQVLKFGGSSVANAENIRRVISIIKHLDDSNITIVVVSALGGITDLLIKCSNAASIGDESYREFLSTLEDRHLQTAKDLISVRNQSSILSFIKTQCNEIEDLLNGIFILKELTPRSLDRIISYGELLSSKIIFTALQSEIKSVNWIDSRLLIKTNADHGYAVVDFEKTNHRIKDHLSENPAQVYLAPGFIAATESGINTTLGRGGSDYSAAIFSAAIHADRLEIWTDVSGIMTADPRLVKNARTIAEISYQEAMELSHFGAKVIYPPTIQPVMNLGIPVWVKNTFHPGEAGTLIQQRSNSDQASTVTGISSINKIALVSLEGSGMVGIPGFSRRLFQALAEEKINVILITQSSSEHSICVGVDEENASRAKSAIDTAFAWEINLQKVQPLYIETDLAIVALVGDRMKNHTGISGKLFSALGRNGVNIRAISQGSSERNISTVISKKDVTKAINVIHESFFETEVKEVNVFIAGTGNVGTRLLAQVKKQKDYLLNDLRIKIKIAGIANSKKFLVNEESVSLENWQDDLKGGREGNINDYVSEIIRRNLRNTVFVDITANETVAFVYEQLLVKSIAVVACNKIACSSSYSHYRKLKELSTEYNAPFLFETNVGASLPVIGALNDLLRSGDSINAMSAVLSGTLNFVFNNYNGERSFASVVKQAQDEGYTEPDPRLDLGGKDVMRKIMILAREAGQAMEMEEIKNNSFMPEECMQGTVKDFYKSMEKHEAHFKALYDAAAIKSHKLKFVASYKNGSAEVGLQHIDPDHDFFHLYGKDNIILFHTDRYIDQPLVIKGAGAGAEVTASGVFADIIRTARS